LPVTARRLGTTVERLAELEDFDQMWFVLKYLEPFAGRMATLADAYFAVFYPAAIGKAPTFVLFRRGQVAYEQNAGFDRMHTGQITCGDVVATVAKLYDAAIVKPRLSLVDTEQDTEPPPAMLPTIRIGSSGAVVSAWQMLVGVVADGQFGQQTEKATIAWQVAHSLKADGIVGPKTWAAAPHVADLEDLGGSGEA
jgi:peptidoglycan hydrolase-like protein with peptidoglycan-binding domain